MEKTGEILAELENRIERLENQISELSSAVQKNKTLSFSKPEAVSDSRRVWESYRVAYKSRYQVDPVRNGMINKLIQTLVSRLGVKEAVNVVNFYVMQNDHFYLLKMHPMGVCVKDAETLRTKWMTGRKITEAEARKTEHGSASIDASSDYLKAKYREIEVE